MEWVRERERQIRRGCYLSWQRVLFLIDRNIKTEACEDDDRILEAQSSNEISRW